MKLVIVVADGAADEAYKELGMQTPLQFAHTRWMDRMTREGQVGLIDFQRGSISIGSQAAFLNLFGIHPSIRGLDRSYFEAKALRAELGPRDIVFRCNVVRLKDNRLADFTAGQLSDKASTQYLTSIPRPPAELTLYHTKSYRNLSVWKDCPVEVDKFDFLPPHEHIGVQVGMNLHDHSPIADFCRASQRDDLILWPWGPSRSIELRPVPYSLGVVTAMEFLAGMAEAVGGIGTIPRWATGYGDSDYESKSRTVHSLLKSCDVVIVHLNAPDEEAHIGDVWAKVEAIEKADMVVRNMFTHLVTHYEDWRLVVTTDHYTLCRTRAHAAGACPYAIMGNRIIPSHIPHFHEFIPSGPPLNPQEAIFVWAN